MSEKENQETSPLNGQLQFEALVKGRGRPVVTGASLNNSELWLRVEDERDSALWTEIFVHKSQLEDLFGDRMRAKDFRVLEVVRLLGCSSDYEAALELLISNVLLDKERYSPRHQKAGLCLLQILKILISEAEAL